MHCTKLAYINVHHSRQYIELHAGICNMILNAARLAYLLIVKNPGLHDNAFVIIILFPSIVFSPYFLYQLNILLPELELLGRSRHSTTLRAMFSLTDFAMESRFRYPAISETAAQENTWMLIDEHGSQLWNVHYRIT